MGKEAAEGISPLIDKYSEVGDTVIDHFGLWCIMLRSVSQKQKRHCKRLESSCKFYRKESISKDVNIAKVKKEWESIKKELKDFVNELVYSEN